MEIKEEYLDKIIILNKASYELREIIEEVNSGKNCYHDLPEFEDINLLNELNKLEIFPSEKDNLWMLTNKIIKNRFFDHGEGHNCYWNDSFYLANRFNLSEFSKKRSAIVALWNGRNHYWEWHTHHGFDNVKLLKDMNLAKERDSDIALINPKEYCSITRNLHDKIKDYFKLTNDDLRSARWINKTVWEKEQDCKIGKNKLETAFNLDF